MYRVERLSTYSNQVKSVTLPDGTTIILTFYYVSMQMGWFLGVKYGDFFEVKNIRITRQPNMLRQFKNLIPFGLACIGDREPTLLADFESEVCELFILTEDEVFEYEDFLTNE